MWGRQQVGSMAGVQRVKFRDAGVCWSQLFCSFQVLVLYYACKKLQRG